MSALPLVRSGIASSPPPVGAMLTVRPSWAKYFRSFALYSPASSDVGTASTVIVFDSRAPVGPGMATVPAELMESLDPLLLQALSVTSDAAITRGYISLPIRLGWPMSIYLSPQIDAAASPRCQECD